MRRILETRFVSSMGFAVLASSLLSGCWFTRSGNSRPDEVAGKRGDTGAKSAPENHSGPLVDPCTLKEDFCTMEFRPATCQLTYNGRTLSQGGSNACQARMRQVGS